MTGVDADPAALEALRQALSAFDDNQRASLGVIENEAQRTRDALELSRQRWEREVANRERTYGACMSAAAEAAHEGGWVDCSGERAALDEATQEHRNVLEWLHRVDQAIVQWRGGADRYRAFLGAQVPAMRTGLNARVTSLEAYLSWTVATQHEAGLRLGERWPSAPVEKREASGGSPERRG